MDEGASCLVSRDLKGEAREHQENNMTHMLSAMNQSIFGFSLEGTEQFSSSGGNIESSPSVHNK